MAATHLDGTYHFIISAFVERGQAPHFTEIAARFETVPAFVQRLLEVSNNSPFWDLRPD